DALPANGVGYGVQINSSDLVRPANVPPQQSAFLPYGGRQVEADARGYVGDGQVFQRCDVQRADTPGGAVAPGSGLAPPAGGFPPVAGGGAPSDLPPGGGFPPVVGGQPVDPNASNLAIRKTQNCRLAGVDKAECDYTFAFTNTGATPFEFAGGSIEDVFSA